MKRCSAHFFGAQSHDECLEPLCFFGRIDRPSDETRARDFRDSPLGRQLEVQLSDAAAQCLNGI
ncbi:MAG: hypothetical protein ACYS7Y_13100, partial [Planctomycetota bacterium]